MRRIRVLICSVDETTPDEMTELAAFDLPALDVTALQPETALDDLEAMTHETGTAILRRVLQAQWETLDAQLTVQHRQRFSPCAGHSGRARVHHRRQPLRHPRVGPPGLLPPR